MKNFIQLTFVLFISLFAPVALGASDSGNQKDKGDAFFENEQSDAQDSEFSDAEQNNEDTDFAEADEAAPKATADPGVSYKDVSNISATLQKQYTDLDDELPLVHVYTVDEINAWVETGTHLNNMTSNQCQFSQDIEQRARKNVASAYEFLFAEMLISGVCYSKDVQSGVYYMNKAAQNGYPAAMAKLAFYYEIGRYVYQDEDRAVSLMHEAAMTGYVPARIDWVGMLLRGLGSPRDYEEAYGWLHNSVPATLVQFNTSDRYLKELSTKMPAYAVRRAKTHNYY